MEFKRLPDFPKYKIYSNGDVYSEWGKTEKLLKLRLSNRGYNRVILYQNGKPKQFAVHRLIAMLFIPNQDLKKEVDHINRVKTDNRIENLRWLDRSGQNLNRYFKENNTGYPFITKSKQKKCKSGFCFKCIIKRNTKRVMDTSRATMEDAIEVVRTFLLENEWVLEHYDRDKINTIKNKYNIS